MTTLSAVKLISPYTFHQADAAHLPFADQTFDLVFGSPPYCDARTYGIDAQRGCIEWVKWMIQCTLEAQRVCKGPVLWVAAGVTRKRNYWPACEGLMWEWWKRGGDCQLYRPCYWHRVGIPGSGGDDWFRADVEYVMCFKRPGALPWADNTAMGHPPKWGPGGEMSHRMRDGSRINSWGVEEVFGGASGCGGTSSRQMNGEYKRRYFNGNGFKKRYTKSRADGSDEIQEYEPPVKANPGNLVGIEWRFLSIIDKLADYGAATKTDPCEVLRGMRQAIDAHAISRWWCRIIAGIFEAALLQSQMSRQNDGTPEWTEVGRPTASGQENRPSLKTPDCVRELRSDTSSRSASQGRGCDEQRAGESSGSLHEVPSKDAQERELFGARLQEAILGDELLLASLLEIQEVWESINEGDESAFRAAGCSNLIKVVVGGGVMGHSYAHLNEAPFPEDLARWFIKSLCPPGGKVLDPFSGSGTTVDVAVQEDRIGLGTDIRQSQIELGYRRLRDPNAKKVKREKKSPGEMDLFSARGVA